MKIHATGPTVATLAAGDVVRVDGIEREVAHVGGTQERPVVRFDGTDDRDAAAELRGHEIRVAPQLLPEPDFGEFYVRDLVGCRVSDGAKELGEIVEITSGPANDALILERGGRRSLIAFVAETIVRMDLEAREILVRPDQAVELPSGA